MTSLKQEVQAFTDVDLSRFRTNDFIDSSICHKEIFEFIIGQLAEEDVAEKRWLEKTPAHINSFEFIKNLYPNSKFIFIVRSPLDAIGSCKKNIHPHVPPIYLAKRWKKEVVLAEEIENKDPNSFLIVKYEDLVGDTKNSMEDICRFLNISFDNETLNDFQNISHKFIMPFEKWKEGNKKQLDYKKNKFKSDYKFVEKLQLQIYLKNQINKYSFDIVNPISFKTYLFFKKIKIKIGRN